MSINTFIATVEGDNIYAINSVSQERAEVGITKKAAQELQTALSNVVAERDEYFEKCIQAGIIEKKKTPEEIASEALAEARAARKETEKMMSILTSIQEHLTQPKES